MPKKVLVVDSLTKIFHAGRRFFFFKSSAEPFTAVKNLSFELKEGEILGILGPNGAGKTTLIEMLLGALKPTSGSIKYFGKELKEHRSELLHSVTHASAYHRLPPSITIQENLEIIARLYGIKKAMRKERIDTLVKQFDIEAIRYKQTGKLSAGQITRVQLCKAFLPSPKVVLLDEPTASLDPDIAKETREFILREQKERMVSVIITSHNMQEVAHICDRALVMQKGVIIQEDTPKMLAKSVSLTEIVLRVTKNCDKLVSIIDGKYTYRLHDETVIIDLDEALIAPLLKTCALQDIEIAHIDIRKPSLEDFFLAISKRRD
jgi:ABC-2 type transport system ATP-binding protein